VAEHPNVLLARASLEAFMRGDVEQMAASLADDVVWHVPGVHRFAGEFRGREEVVDRFRRMAAADVRTIFEEIHDVVGNDEHVVALVNVRFDAPGGSVPTRSVHVMHVEDGRVVQFWSMNDRQDEVDHVIGR
jgi:uncharacterized protein